MGIQIAVANYAVVISLSIVIFKRKRIFYILKQTILVQLVDMLAEIFAPIKIGYYLIVDRYGTIFIADKFQFRRFAIPNFAVIVALNEKRARTYSVFTA